VSKICPDLPESAGRFAAKWKAGNPGKQSRKAFSVLRNPSAFRNPEPQFAFYDRAYSQLSSSDFADMGHHRGMAFDQCDRGICIEQIGHQSRS
jgi:hypothetical protein